MNNLFDKVNQKIYEERIKQEKEDNKWLFNTFVTNKSIEPINAQQILNAIKDFKEYTDKNSTVIMCSPKTKLAVIEQHLMNPLTYFLADYNVPDDVCYVVTDEHLKRVMIDALKAEESFIKNTYSF